ncbi:MAG: hypothetical protein HZA19_05265, partial [Nitrospirae bacterium]|nr:hypothetical protein [Nitrospirota bacterium]
MKKLLAIVAVTVAATVWYAFPALAATFDVSGDYRVRGFMIQSQDFTEDGDSNWLDVRFRTNLVVKQGMTTGVVQLDFLGNNAMNDSSNGNLVLGNSTGHSYDLLGVRQAYVAINFPNYTLIGGRYELKLGNGLVLNDTTDLVAAVVPAGPVNLLVGYLVLSDDDNADKLNNPGTCGALGPVCPPGNLPTDATALAINAGLNAGGWNWNLFGVFAQISSDIPASGSDENVNLNT